MPDAQLWAAGPATTLVSELTSSPSLAPRPEVVLLPSTVAVMPTSVPRVTPGGASVVPPTTTLGVSVVVADRGNMPLDRALVSARVVPQGPGTVSASSVNVALEPSSTVAVTLPTLSVAPGDSYTLTVSVLPPAGQANLATTSFSYALDGGPADAAHHDHDHRPPAHHDHRPLAAHHRRRPGEHGPRDLAASTAAPGAS